MADFELELRTTALPTVRTDSAELLAPSEGGRPSWLVRWLRPELVVRHPFGTSTWAPAGAPGASSWPLLAVVVGLVLVVLVALAVVGLVSLLRRR